MDCHRPLAFAMTNVAKSCKFFFIFLLINKRIVVYGLLRRFTPRNDKGNKRQYSTHSHCDYGLVIARIAFAIRGNLVMGYCGTQPITVIARLWKSHGNLSMATTILNTHHHCENHRFVAILVWGVVFFVMTSIRYYPCERSELIHNFLPSYHCEKLNNLEITSEKCKNVKIQEFTTIHHTLIVTMSKRSNSRQLIANTKAEKKNLLIK